MLQPLEPHVYSVAIRVGVFLLSMAGSLVIIGIIGKEKINKIINGEEVEDD